MKEEEKVYISEERKEKFQFHLDRFNKSVREGSENPRKRIEVLLNTISGAGIFLIFNVLKEIEPKNLLKQEMYLLVFAGIGFLLAIVLSFFSQYILVRLYDNMSQKLNGISNLKDEYGTSEIDEFKKILKYFNNNARRIGKNVNWLFKVAVLIMISSLSFIGVFLLKYFSRLEYLIHS